MKEGEKVKYIEAAWIEQILQFDSKLEYLAYVEELKQGNKKFKEMSYNQNVSGKVVVRIRKQYNNNNFPDD